MPTLELTGSKAAYEEAGVGLPLILIPGITEYKESFLYQFRGMSDKYRVISYDVRASGSQDIAAHSEDLAKLLDGLRLPSAVIAGHCFGGLIAQQFAQAHPDRTTALILISTFAKAPDNNQGKLLRYMSSAHIGEEEGTVAAVKRAIGMAKLPQYDPEDHLGWVAKQAAKTSQRTINERIRAIRAFDSRPWLEQIWAPLLLLVGQHDRPPFLSAAQMIQRGTPDSVVEVIEGAAHFPHIERHDLVNSYIDDFIGSRLMSLVD